MAKEMSILKKVNPNKSVAFKNELLASPYKKHPALSLSVPQTKMILYMVSQINMGDKEFKPVQLNFKEFCSEFNISYEGGKNRELLKTHVYSLMSKILEIREGSSVAIYHWLEKARIDFSSQTIELTLANAMRPYYLELKENFTTYQLGYVSEFKNKYSFLLYDILKRWQNYNSGEFYYSIDNLRNDLVPGKYPDMRDFNRYVFKPAIAEINQKSDILIDYRFIKEGKSIKTVCFLIKQKDTKALNKIKSKWNTDLDLYSAEKEAFEDMREQLCFEGFDTEEVVADEMPKEDM